MLKRLMPFAAILLVLLDTVFTLVQHYQTPLDGDMANIIWPGQYYKQVLEDPFGLDAFLQQQVYAAPNRFFAHWFMSAYFKALPLWLQPFFNPIDSVYAAAAFLKTGIQGLLLIMLALLSSKWLGTGIKGFLLALVLLFPLFQTAGFTSQMGFVDQAPTYAVFYGLPFGVLLVFMSGFMALERALPVFIKALLTLLLLALAVVLALSGPLIPPMAIIGLPLLALYAIAAQTPESTIKSLFHQNPVQAFFRLPKLQLLAGCWFLGWCFYSVYIGFYNAENPTNAISIAERYARLPFGFYYLLVRKIGLPLLLLMILVNVLLLRKRTELQARTLLTILQWIGIFALLYLLLLPLGGYREYRPNIIRKDTFMPVLLPLIFFYAVSTLYLLRNLEFKARRFYVAGLAALLVLFTISDKPLTGANSCERAGLETISRASETIVELPGTCTILEWHKVTDYRIIEAHARLLQFWGITKEKKYYVQP